MSNHALLAQRFTQPTTPAPVGGYPTETTVTYTAGNLFGSDFSAVPANDYGPPGVTTSELSTVFGGASVPFLDSRGVDEMKIVPTGDYPHLECRHVPQSNGTERIGFGVAMNEQEAWLAFDLFFVNQPDGSPFIFNGSTSGTSGGKLHGFSGGSINTTTGGSGGGTAVDGWSMRVPWKANGSIQAYFYHPDKPGEYGDALYYVNEFGKDNARYYMPTNQWLRHVVHVKLNTGASNFDGEFNCYVDEFGGAGPILRARRTGLRWWQKSTAAQIDRMFFSCFYGGGTSDWAPSETTYTRHRNFQVSNVGAWSAA